MEMHFEKRPVPRGSAMQGKSTTPDDDDDIFLPHRLQVAHGLMEQLACHGAKYVRGIANDFKRLADAMPDDIKSGSLD